MAEKKLTIKDIAAACGVSTATVSYVLNGRQDQRISEETSKKILHFVQMHGYESSPVARALASGSNNAVGLYLSLNGVSNDRAGEHLLFARRLAERLEELGYSLRMLTDTCLTQTDRTVDAIVAVDVSREQFYALGDNCFYPLLSVDGLVNDPTLFYQIYDDYAAIREKAALLSGHGAVYLLAPPCQNAELNDYINGCFDGVCLSEDSAAVAQFAGSLPDNSALVVHGAGLYREAARLTATPPILFGRGVNGAVAIEPFTEEKTRITARLVRDTIHRCAQPEHDVRVR